MDFLKILVFVVAGCLLVIGRVSAYYNQTYGSYTFIISNVNADNSLGKSALTNAQDWCRSNGYTLATIPNKEAQSYIKQFISSAVSSSQIATNNLIILNGKLYTSLPGTWIWVNGQQRNGDVNIQGQLDPSQRYFYGFLQTSDYKIYASTHNNGRHFICEKPGASDCVGGLPLNGRCYQRKTSSLTWYSARNECLDGGGDLASFETLTDDTFRSTLGSTLLANVSATEYWVGMQRVEWRWEDTVGHAIKYTNWEGGSPSNAFECLSLRVTSGTSEWFWFSFGCSMTYQFICLAANQPTGATSSTVAKDTSLTKSSSVAVLSTPTSHTLSVQPASATSMSSIPTTNAVALGLGIGLGMGAILVVAIVLGVIFIRRRHKSKSNPYSEPTSSSDATARSDLKESDIDADHEEMKNNGTNNYNAPNGNANPGAIYAAVQPRGTLLPPTNYAETHGQQIVYADFDLVQKP